LESFSRKKYKFSRKKIAKKAEFSEGLSKKEKVESFYENLKEHSVVFFS
jgi:hypothetical protein